MTTRSKFLKKLFILFSFFLLCWNCFAEAEKWTLAAVKFEYVKGQDQNSVTENISEMLPAEIMSKLSSSLKRNIIPDEKFQRERYKLLTERQNLYLQLSAEYKKRDSLVLMDYSDAKLKAELKAERKKIREIEEQIEENLSKLKEKEKENEELMSLFLNQTQEGENSANLSEEELVKKFFKNIFVKEESILNEENIDFYKNNEGLFNVDQDEGLEYTDFAFEKKVVSAGIKGLITGNIAAYGNYISISTDFYRYPGAEKAGSIMEVGSVDDLDIITSSIASQLLPLVTNALPVEFIFSINPPQAAENLSIYIDDVIQKNEDMHLILNSGTHRIQLISQGYVPAGTTFFFEGNKKYKIDVKFEEQKLGHLQIGIENDISGDFYTNGQEALKVDEKKSQVVIDGKVILGTFITEDGRNSYFYVPEKLTKDENFINISPKPEDRMEYINTRRKWMYGAYTLFMVSLIPTFYTYSNFQIQSDLYKKQQADYNMTKNWQTASTVCEIISIGLGVFWGIELVRYLVAANSVLPQKVKQGDQAQYEYYTPPAPESGQEKNEENKELNKND